MTRNQFTWIVIGANSILSLFFFICYFDNIIFFGDVQSIHFPMIMEDAKALPTTGILNKKGKMVTLKVSDNYINQLYPVLARYLSAVEKKCLRPSSLTIGGHITLFKSQRALLPIGKSYHFDLNGMIKETVIRTKYHLIVYETWYELSVSSSGLNQSFLHHINPDRLHISIAVARSIAGTHICVN